MFRQVSSHPVASKNKDAGFTLTELMVAVAIVATGLTLALPNFARSWLALIAK